MISRVLDSIIERTVIPSFSNLGYKLRRRLFNWPELNTYQLENKVVVLTGGTSGIGREAASVFAALGATLVIVGRNPEKTRLLVQELIKDSGNQTIHAVIGDLGEREDVQHIADNLASRFPVINVLIHNAGALFNSRKLASNGTDLSVELMVATPFLLTGKLLPQLNAASQSNEPARVLTMSSGGMYTEALTVDGIEMSDAEYQGAKQYARAKRAQVVLNEMWAEKFPTNEIIFHALHPGWVETPGIAEALPGFTGWLDKFGLLRTPHQGADTLVWLSADEIPGRSNGAFWHDRAIRRINMSSKTRDADTPQTRNALWQWCEEHTQWQFSA